MDLHTALARLETFQQFVAGYLQESRDGGQDGGDYGPIPGAGKKKVLLKSGADKLCELYGIYDEYSIESHENFETNLFFYRVKCILKSRNDDSVVGTGLGSCSTWESKYRWRESQRKCPTCGASAIIKGKEEYGGGWLCWKKKDGCGAKFAEIDAKITEQATGRVENPDILDTVNTVLKMAKKRAKIDAVIGVTRSSGLFTQDMEDLPPAPAAPEPAIVTEAKTFTRPSGKDAGSEPANSGTGSPVTTTPRHTSAGSVKGEAGTERPPAPPAAPKEGRVASAPSREDDVVDFSALADALTSTGKNSVATEAALKAAKVVAADDPDKTIAPSQQRELHIDFKKAIPKDAAETTKKSADVIFREWLKHEGFTDKDGLGSTKSIPAILLKEVTMKALKFAGTLR
jgi:hypothetical protein